MLFLLIRGCPFTPFLAPCDEQAWYTDADGDGYGQGAAVYACEAPPGTVDVSGDCDDTDPAVTLGSVWFVDGDGDGYGAPVVACEAPSVTVADATDCDDADPAVNPGAVEVCNNGVDDDCDSVATGCTGLAGDYASDAAAMRAFGEGFTVGIVPDIDGDQLPDLALGSFPLGTTRILSSALRGDVDPASAALATLSLGFGSESDAVVGVGDLLGNGLDAMVVASYVRSAVYVFEGPMAGEVGGVDADVTVHAVDGHFAAGDIDGDGAQDLAVSQFDGTYVFYGPLTTADVAMSEASATLSPSGRLAADADLDGDGLAELVTSESGSGWSCEVSVFAGGMTGDVDVAEASMSVECMNGLLVNVTGLGDLDDDGYDDLGAGVAYTDGGAVYLLRGPLSGSGMLQSVSDAQVSSDGVTWLGGSLGAGDVDGDGSRDLITASTFADTTQTLVFAGDITGSISSDAAFARIRGGGIRLQAQGLAVGDVDADGVDDLWLAGDESSLLFLGLSGL
jgi:hypothetical protein